MYYSGNISSGSPLIDGADDRDGALALLLRLMGRGFMGAESPTHLFVGRLPNALPVDIPLPDGAHVVGSQVLGPVATIVLDVDLPAQQALDFYRDRLQADGWTAQEQPWTHSGFATPPFAPPLTYCKSARPVLVGAGDGSGGRADRRAAQPQCRPAPVALRAASSA